MAEGVYNIAKSGLLDGTIDLNTHDIRTLLLVGGLTFNPDHATVAAVIAANTEASDGSYARVALTGEAVVVDNAADRGEFTANTVDYGALDNTTPTAMVVYKHVTNDSDSLPISFHDTGFGSAANGAGYTIEFPNDILRAT